MPQIELKNLTKYFVNKKDKTALAALYKLDAIFYDSKVNVVLGESGSGKSVLLKCIAGIEKIDEGEILFDNKNVSNTRPKARDASIMTQEFALYPHLTVFDNIAYPLKVERIPQDEIRERVTDVIHNLGIDVISNRFPREISIGQAQRVALGRAIVKRPSLLLLDEPFSNLDYQLKIDILKELKDIQKRLRLTIIYVTHNLSEASIMADYITILNNGEVVECGKCDELFNNKKSYLYRNFINIGNE